MKKNGLFVILCVVLMLFTDCQSSKSSTESTTDSSTLDEVVVSGRKNRSSRDVSATSGKKDAPPPPPPPPSVTKEIIEHKAETARTEIEFESAREERVEEIFHIKPSSVTTSPSVMPPRTAEPSRAKTPRLSTTPPPPPPPSRDIPQKPLPKASQLTAGEVNDFSKWALWDDIAKEKLAEHAQKWRFLPEKRYAVQVRTESGSPLVNCEVRLQRSTGNTLWTARTDNTGKAELWNKIFDKNEATPSKITAKYQRESYTIKDISIFQEGVNTIEIPVTCTPIQQRLDLAFVVDATGSMQDEINYLKAELNDVIERVQVDLDDTEVNLGSVFYRDTGDKYLTRKSDFSTNISETIDFIKKQNADGGGDYPEGVDAALEVALNELKWNDNSTSKLLFLVLDAPPHSGDETLKKIEKYTRLAAQKGVRIIPVACSGIRKGTEYLMRAIALATNGTYTFLTDDSGIGGSHIKPTTDKFKVEKLNDLLVRIITQYSKTPDCDEEFTDIIDDINNGQQNQQIVWEYYPNPTSGNFTVKADQNIEELFVTDLNGKLLLRRTGRMTNTFQLNIGEFPTGIYVVKCHFENDTWESGRIVLVHDR